MWIEPEREKLSYIATISNNITERRYQQAATGAQFSKPYTRTKHICPKKTKTKKRIKYETKRNQFRVTRSYTDLIVFSLVFFYSFSIGIVCLCVLDFVHFVEFDFDFDFKFPDIVVQGAWWLNSSIERI